ncbi:DNRLRE domain-containing protein [Metabacillus fastidiosus]|uniref:DNRLRE domain-containing protein n=1 Tax=Metabacillus fastidiosus TaxID=1458 RepID=UPI003D281542
MTYPLKGLVLHLHSALANKGYSQGVNSAPVTEWFDLTRKGNNGSLINFDTTQDRGWVGINNLTDPYSLYFNGLNNHVVIPKNSELLPTDSGFTFETWVRPVKSGYIVSYGGSSEQGFSLYFDLDNLEIIAKVNTPTNKMTFVFNNINYRTWQHISLLYDGQRLWAMLNAAPQGFSIPELTTCTVPNSPLALGKSSTANDGFFSGNIATLRVYSRALEWSEISDSYGSGYLLNSKVSDIPSRGLVLWRKDLNSNINVSMVTKVKARYETRNVGLNDLPSQIGVTHYNELYGDLDVNPIAYIRAKYDTVCYSSNDLQSEIKVTKPNNLPCMLSINPYTRLVGKYDSEPLHQPDLESNISVNNPYDLVSSLFVNLEEVSITARYSTDRASYDDLPSLIEVNHVSDLVSLIGVNLNINRYMRANYQIDTVEISDLESSITVSSTSHLPSTVSIFSTSYMRARYGTSGIFIEDLLSTITITGVSELKGNVAVPVKTTLTARYGISPLITVDLPTELGIKEWDELSSNLFVNPRSYMRAAYIVEPIYFEWLPSSIDVKGTSELKSSIFVMKPLILRAHYDLIERPNRTTKLYPNRDAFVREFFPKLNYGIETQMYVGSVGSPFPEKYRSLVGFDITSIPTENTEIGRAILRLYYDGRGAGSKTIQVLEPNGQWTEKGVTWANQPTSVSQGFSKTFEVGDKAGYIEVDVTELVKSWHKFNKPNFGFLLKALNEIEVTNKGFYTKEAVERRPELEITYYDMQVYSSNYSLINANMTVRQSKTRDLKGSLKIKDNKGASSLPANLRVHQPNELECFIWINYPQIESEIVVRRKEDRELPSSLVIRTVDADDLVSSISANEREKPSSIYVPYRYDTESDITVRRWGNPDTDGGQLPSEIGVSEVNKDSSIYILYRDDLLSSFDVRLWAKEDDPQNNLPSNFEITRNFELHGDLEIKERAQIDGGISIRVEKFDDQPSNVYVRFRDDLIGYGNIGNPNLNCSIEVWEKSLLQGSLKVRREDGTSLPSIINIPIGGWDTIPSTINLRMMHDVPGKITVMSGNLQSSIAVPMNANRNLLSVLDVRVRRSSDLESNLGINSGNFYSEISVRVPDHYDKAGKLTVRQEDDANLPIEGYVRNWVNLFSRMAVSKPRYRDLYSYFKVRCEDWSDLVNSITVRQWGDPEKNGGQIDSGITVRVEDKHDQDSSIAVRREDWDDLGGTILVKQISDLPSDTTVKQTDKEDLASWIAVYELYELYGEITIRQWGDPTKDGGDLHSSITVRQYAERDLNGLIKVFEHYNVDGSISVRRWGDPNKDGGQLPSTIAVRVVRSNDKPSDITVRQKDAKDLWTYIFAVRQYGESDLPVTALVKRVSNLECSIEIVTAYPYAYIM